MSILVTRLPKTKTEFVKMNTNTNTFMQIWLKLTND